MNKPRNMSWSIMLYQPTKLSMFSKSTMSKTQGKLNMIVKSENNHTYTSPKGFTLIELLLVVALMAIAVGVTSDILVSLVRSYNKSQVINEIEQNANFISQKLIKELRNARRVTALNPADPTPLQQGDYYTAVTFEDTNTNDITYSVVNGVLLRDTGSGAQPLTVNSAPQGVVVSCGVGTECFTLISTSPEVIRISLLLTQAGNPANLIFQGEVPIEDTIVIRDTY